MDNTLEELLSKKSFVLWIKGEASMEEEKVWDTWLREKPERKMLVKEAREMIGAIYSEHDTPNPRIELEKLERSIDQYEGRENQYSEAKYNHSDRISRGAVAAAIIFMIIVLSSVAVYHNAKDENKPTVAKTEIAPREYNTNYGEKVTYQLSDGSQIILNANSQLRFSSKAEKGLNTEVWLQGEAYFDITHLEGNQQRTFTVHTRDGSVNVLGTRFSVNTFGEETQTVLEQGKIRVQIQDEEPATPAEYILEPGELARFAANENKIAVRDVNTQVYTSWREDKLIFENTPMNEVARRIEHTFGIAVMVSERFATETLSGSIKSNNIEVLTEALSEILDTSISQREQKLFIGFQGDR